MQLIHMYKYFFLSDNITDIVDYASDVEILGKTDFMQEIFSPSFIVLASCVAVATLIVILLIGLICNKICSRYVYGVKEYHQKNDFLTFSSIFHV